MDLYAALALASIVIAAVLLNLWQLRRAIKAAEVAKRLLAANNAVADKKLDEIHGLVNSRLSDALQTIEDLKALLLLALSAAISPDDPRVRDAIAKNS